MENHTHLLVVDDDVEIRESLRDLLTDEGYEVTTAANGREAIQMLMTNVMHPCLVLLDLMMPVMSGYEVLDLLRQNQVLARIPIVVVSAQRNPPPGNVGLLKKPIDIDALLSLVGQHCGPQPTA